QRTDLWPGHRVYQDLQKASRPNRRHGARPHRLRDAHRAQTARGLRQDVPIQRPMRQGPKGAVLGEIIAVVGPTASGKTELAVAVAEKVGGEIVSADSRQVYRRLDAATAKPGKNVRVPYHLTDLVEPDETFDAGRFGELARKCFAEIISRGRRPILCGGTGLY